MQRTLCAVFFWLATTTLYGQLFYFPKSSKVYRDTFAVQFIKKLDQTSRNVQLHVETAFGETGYEASITDSIAVVPYYTLYDNSPMSVHAVPVTRRDGLRADVIFLKPMPKIDSLESLIIKVLDTPSPENILRLARAFEKNDCYGIALLAYYKLYRLGYHSYWFDFMKRNNNILQTTKSVHR